MQRAQIRDAAQSQKFFFRREVLPPGSVTPSSRTSSASDLSGTQQFNGKKLKKMMNCFMPMPPPEQEIPRSPVEAEYEEMTMNEIMNGKVWIDSLHARPHCNI
jgi:glutamate--cysteine ligase catalytic subunit